MSVTEMYVVRRLMPNDIIVRLPTCMYKMKNVHLSKTQMADRLSNNTADGNITAQDISLPDLVMIENRQKLLLNQLEDLKQQLLRVKSILKLEQPERIECSLPPNVHISQNMPQVPDILIRVDPRNPPYSLLFVQKLLRNQCQIALTAHLHSNVVEIGENAEIFLRKFKDSDCGDNGRCTVNIKLIWNTLEISRIESCIGNSLLLGEVNLLRYLSHLIPNMHYEQQHFDEINYLLDTIYFHSTMSTDINNCLDILISYLNKNDGMFLCGSTLSIADIAAWSALKQFRAVNLNVLLSKWMHKCESVST